MEGVGKLLRELGQEERYSLTIYNKELLKDFTLPNYLFFFFIAKLS